MRLGALVDRYPDFVPDLHPPEPECPRCGNYERQCECARAEEEDTPMSSLTFDPGVAQRMRFAMDQGGITEAELARRVGVRPETVRDWVTGSGFPSTVFHAALARALGATVEWLMVGEVTEALAGVPAFTHHCQDCGRGMLEHGVCRVDGREICFFCAKKSGQVEQAPETSQLEPAKETRAKRARRTPAEMRVTAESGGTVLEQPFLDEQPTTTSACRCGNPDDCHCDPRPEDCGPTCTCSNELEPPRPPTWQELLDERRELDARKKAVSDQVEARIKQIDEQLWPLFSDEQPRLEHSGYTLTRVAPEPKTVVSWDVERAIYERGIVLEAMLKPYRTEQVKTTQPYLKGTVAKGGARS